VKPSLGLRGERREAVINSSNGAPADE
jgi:hypothetical protein